MIRPTQIVLILLTLCSVFVNRCHAQNNTEQSPAAASPSEEGQAETAVAESPTSAAPVAVATSAAAAPGVQASATPDAATAVVAVSPSIIIEASPSIQASVVVQQTVSPAAPLKKYQVTFSLSQNWTADYADASSASYLALKVDIENAVRALLAGANIQNVSVVSFSEGSVVVVLSTVYASDTTDSMVNSSMTSLKTSVNDGAVGGISTVPQSMTFTASVDGVWGSWQEGSCDCSNKTLGRTRVCNEPSGGGAPCVGLTTETVSCTPTGCSGGSTLSIALGILTAVVVAPMLLLL